MESRNVNLVNISLEELEGFIQEAVASAISSFLISNESEDVDRLLTKNQVSDLLNISLPTLTKYVKKGVIPAYRIGSNIRFKESEVKASLEIVQKNMLNLKR